MTTSCKNRVVFNNSIEGWELFNETMDKACNIISSLPQTECSRGLSNVVKDQLVTELNPIIENMELEGHGEDAAKMQRIRDTVVNLSFVGAKRL